MRTLMAAVALVALASCGSEGADRAIDPGGSGDGAGFPGTVPAASGAVHTRGLVTVMDTGRPELCLGPVAESYPPQCGGPALVGWDWADREGMFDHQGDIRWGEFAVTGTWDGTAFTVDGAIPAALYDAAAPDQPEVPAPAREYTEAELTAIAEEVGGNLAGAQGAYAADGHVFVDVTYDDGSLQAWADEEYGTHVVLVSSMLLDGR